MLKKKKRVPCTLSAMIALNPPSSQSMLSGALRSGVSELRTLSARCTSKTRNGLHVGLLVCFLFWAAPVEVSSSFHNNRSPNYKHNASVLPLLLCLFRFHVSCLKFVCFSFSSFSFLFRFLFFHLCSSIFCDPCQGYLLAVRTPNRVSTIYKMNFFPFVFVFSYLFSCCCFVFV